VSCILKLSSTDCKKCLINVNDIINDFEHIDVQLDADDQMLQILEEAKILKKESIVRMENEELERKIAYYPSGLIFYTSPKNEFLRFCGIMEYPQERETLRFLYNNRVITDTLNITPLNSTIALFDNEHIYQISNQEGLLEISNYINGHISYKVNFDRIDFYKTLDSIARSNDGLEISGDFIQYQKRYTSPILPKFMEFGGMQICDGYLYTSSTVYNNDSIGENRFILRYDKTLIIKWDTAGPLALWAIPTHKKLFVDNGFFSIDSNGRMSLIQTKQQKRGNSFFVTTFQLNAAEIKMMKKKRDKISKQIERKLKNKKEMLSHFALSTPILSGEYLKYPFVGWARSIQRNSKTIKLDYFDPFWQYETLPFEKVISLFDVQVHSEGEQYLIKDHRGIKVKIRSQKHENDLILTEEPILLCTQIIEMDKNESYVLTYTEQSFQLHKLQFDY
jgi:hypothetical protein